MSVSSDKRMNGSKSMEESEVKRKLKKGAKDEFNQQSKPSNRDTLKNQNDHIVQQPLITNFMMLSNSKTRANGATKENQPSHQEIDKIKELKDKILSKDKIIDDMKKNRDVEQNKLNKLMLEDKEFKKKSKNIIAEKLVEIAQLKRIERARVNERLGYFTDNYRNFIEGEDLIKLRLSIKEVENLITKYSISKSRKSIDIDHHERNMAAGQHLNKKLSELKVELAFRQKQIDGYKDRLKLAEKESKCKLSKANWPIIYEKYQSLELLGTGGFGQVYKCFDLEKSIEVAIKISQVGANKDSSSKEQFLKHVKREVEAQKTLSHPNIAALYDLLDCNSEKVVFSMEYCNGCELSLALRKNKCFEEKEARLYVKQMFSALNYLSSLEFKIVHYDLKPANMIFHNGLLKIVDFGLCKIMEDDNSKMFLTSQGVGTYYYLSPETFNEGDPIVSPKVDVWSIGCIFYELLYGKKPFGNGIPQEKVYNQGIILKAYKVDFPQEPPKKYRVSADAKQFIEKCLQYDIEKRLSPNEAYEHPYMQK